MTNHNYLLIAQDTNTVANIVLWDGNTDTWTPPAGFIHLDQATTPALVWKLNPDKTTYSLQEEIGGGHIGDTWDGLTLTTHQPKPA